jgi:hypothetical protein
VKHWKWSKVDIGIFEYSCSSHLEQMLLQLQHCRLVARMAHGRVVGQNGKEPVHQLGVAVAQRFERILEHVEKGAQGKADYLNRIHSMVTYMLNWKHRGEWRTLSYFCLMQSSKSGKNCSNSASSSLCSFAASAPLFGASWASSSSSSSAKWKIYKK